MSGVGTILEEKQITTVSLCLLLQHCINPSKEEGQKIVESPFCQGLVSIASPHKSSKEPLDFYNLFFNEFVQGSEENQKSLEKDFNSPKVLLEMILEDTDIYKMIFDCKVEDTTTRFICNCNRYGGIYVESRKEWKNPIFNAQWPMTTRDLQMEIDECCILKNGGFCGINKEWSCLGCSMEIDRVTERKIFNPPHAFFVCLQERSVIEEYNANEIENVTNPIFLTLADDSQAVYQIVGGLYRPLTQKQGYYLAILKKGKSFYKIDSKGNMEETFLINQCEYFMMEKVEKCALVANLEDSDWNPEPF